MDRYYQTRSAIYDFLRNYMMEEGYEVERALYEGVDSSGLIDYLTRGIMSCIENNDEPSFVWHDAEEELPEDVKKQKGIFYGVLVIDKSGKVMSACYNRTNGDFFTPNFAVSGVKRWAFLNE